MAERKKSAAMARGIFAMLAIGTVPSLFSNPIHYFLGLLICAGIAFALARLLI